MMGWACMAASRTGSLVFTNDVTADTSCKMNSEVYRALLFATIPPNAAKLMLTVQMDNDP